MTQDYQFRDEKLPSVYIVGRESTEEQIGYVLFDIRDFEELNSHEQEVYIRMLIDSSIQFGADENIVDKIEALIASLMNSSNSLSNQVSGNQGYSEFNFAVINRQARLSDLFISDNSFTGEYRDVSIDRLRELYAFEFSEQQEAVYVNWLAHHEGAHCIGLLETGADFFGAAKALQVNPEGRDTIQFIADVRMMDVMFFDPERMGSYDASFFERYQYGYNSYLALQSVLNISAEELASMPDQDLLSAASEFESHINEGTNLGFSECEAHQALWNYNPENSDPPLGATIMRSGDMEGILSLVGRVINTSDFSPTSYEAQVLNDFSRALVRVTDIGYQNETANQRLAINNPSPGITATP